MCLIQSIKEQDPIPYFERELGPAGSRSGGKTFFHSHADDKTPSLCVYPAPDGGYYDYTKGEGGSIIDFVCHHRQVTVSVAIEELRCFFSLPSDNDEKPRSDFVKNETLHVKFDTFRMMGMNGYFAKWLVIRGVSRDDQDAYSDRLNIIAREIGVYDKLFIGDNKNTAGLIFPCMNENREILGGKIRRVDGQLLFGKKSKAITGGRTGVIYPTQEDIHDSDTILLCEGEPDYVILRMMGFDNVIGNLGGVGSCTSVIAKLTSKYNTIVSFYDGDDAGIKANAKLSEKLGRTIRSVTYPKFDGKDKVDVNDLYKLGYRENDFKALVERAKYYNDTVQSTSSENVTVTMKTIEDTHITEKNGGYWIEKNGKDGPKEMQITNFILRRVELCVEDLPDGFHRQYSIMEMELDGIKTKGEFHSSHTSNLQIFAMKIKEINQDASRFCMTSTDMEAMFRYISQQGGDMKVTKKYERIGYMAMDNVWILRNGIMKDGKFNEYVDNIADLGDIRAMVKRPMKAPIFISDRYYKPDIRFEISDIFSYMFCGEAQGGAVLGWLMATIFIQTVYFDLFPYLFTTGEPGSGKTTALRFAMACFGRDKEGENFSDTSRFIEIKNICESGSVALWRDEFENPSRFDKNDKTGLLKSLAMRTPIEKGKADQTSVWYTPIATMMLSGQSPAENSAIFERCCMIYLKKDRNGDDVYKNKAKENMDICPSVFRWIMEHIDVKRDADIFKKIIKDVSDELSVFGIEKRMNDVFTPIIAGYVFWKKMVEGEEDVVWDFFFDMIVSKQQDEKEDSAIDSFFEVIYDEMNMARSGISFNNGGEYIRETNDGYIFVAVSGLYSMYSQNMKITDGEKIPKKAIKKYIIMSYGGKKHRSNARDGIAIPKSKAPKKLFDILERQKSALYPKVDEVVETI